MDKKEALFNYALRLGDHALILSHRLCEWCSWGPFLEEDIALSNIALDFLGQANFLLEYAAELEGKGRTADDLAYRRDEREFFNPKMVELPNKDFAFTIARQFLLDAFHVPFYEALTKSTDNQLAAIAAKALKEVKYHLRHSSMWIKRLGDGTEESHQRIQKAFDDLWMYTGELFEENEIDQILQKEGIAVDLKPVKNQWDATVNEVLAEATLKRPEDGWMQTGRLNGIHTEHLGYILAEMQFLPRAYPDAKW
jgi:ring-1,2-phenylacetyl-CoA epoxidase subunit PaaC